MSFQVKKPDPTPEPTVTIRLSQSDHHNLHEIAREAGITVPAVARQMIEHVLSETVGDTGVVEVVEG